MSTPGTRRRSASAVAMSAVSSTLPSSTMRTSHERSAKEVRSSSTMRSSESLRLSASLYAGTTTVPVRGRGSLASSVIVRSLPRR